MSTALNYLSVYIYIFECHKKYEEKKIQKPYNIEAPSTEVNQTVKSAPQATFFTSDTWQRTGDNSNSTKENGEKGKGVVNKVIMNKQTVLTHFPRVHNSKI